MYEKGRSFVMAGGLVKAYEGHKFVYLHLLCQGFENIGKSILLATNYEKYGPRLKSDFGHDLGTLLDELRLVCGAGLLDENACKQLKGLNEFYKSHRLRYGDKNDMKIENKLIDGDLVHVFLIDIIEVINRKIEFGEFITP